MSHNVIAGGGARSTGGTFAVDGTIGQPAAGTNSAGGAYNLRGGFSAFQASAPTAAFVSVGGRTLTADGRGITNVVYHSFRRRRDTTDSEVERFWVLPQPSAKLMC